MPSLLKEKLVSYYQQPNQLSEIIRKIRIVIDFVASSGCPSETKIIDYAVNILKMSAVNNEESLGQEGVCKELNDLEVVYLRSLWELLNFRRVVLLTEHGHDPFDQLSDLFKSTDYGAAPAGPDQASDDVDNWLVNELSGSRRSINSSVLFDHLSLIYHLIANKLTRQEPAEAQDLAQQNLKDVLMVYFEEVKAMRPNEDASLNTTKLNSSTFKVAHVFGVWKALVRLYTRETSKKV